MSGRRSLGVYGYIHSEFEYLYHLTTKSRRRSIRRNGLTCGNLRSLDYDPSEPTLTNETLSFFVQKPLWVEYNEKKKHPAKTACYHRHCRDFIVANDITWGLLGSTLPEYPGGALELDLWRVHIDSLSRKQQMKWDINVPFDPGEPFRTDYNDDTVVLTTHGRVPPEALTLYRKFVFPDCARTWINAIPHRLEMHLMATGK